MALNHAKIKNCKPKDKDYKLYDEKGLFLLVKKSGALYWRFKYRYDGKEKTLALGVYPEVPLKSAREKRDAARKLLSDGVDPAKKRKEKKQEEKEKEKADANTFKDIAMQWFEEKQPTIREATYKRRLRRFENYVFPKIGDKGIKNINSPDIYEIIKPLIDLRKLETAGRLRAEISAIFDYAIVHGVTDYNPSQAVARQIPKKVVTHRAALINPSEVRDLLIAIDGYRGSYQVERALKISPYLFQRPGEIRQMRWQDIFFETKEWRYLVTKTGINHIVPLSTQVIAILEEMKEFSGKSEYVFPSINSNDKPISDGTINRALRKLGYSGEVMTAHGFRGTASTMLHEQGWNSDAIERQLAHMPGDDVKAAYNRAEHLDERRKMMQSWADYLDGLKRGAEIIPINRAIK